MTKLNIVAVLSTTIAPLDGAYSVTTLDTCPDIQGVPHYIGHPDTKEIVEALGAVQAPSKLFTGLLPGESAVCVPIQQGKSTRATEGFTTPHQAVTLSDLSVRIMNRIDAENPCIFCGGRMLVGKMHCPSCGAC